MEFYRYGIPPEFFFFRTFKLLWELALNSAEFHEVPKVKVSQNSAVFLVQYSEFLCLSGVVHEQVR
jgi:hypothetical protein